MKRTRSSTVGSLIALVGTLFFLLVGGCARAARQEPTFVRTQDVVYGRKFGSALTMDVFTPTKGANQAAVIWVISGGWYSAHEGINTGGASPIPELIKRGYTVFAVVHGSQPLYTIPEAIEDMRRSVRYIRFHATDYKIDPNRIGVTGGSAGGHLSLMLGVAGDDGNPKATDPVDKVSDRVQAVACFFPPTDFLNYGKPGYEALGRNTLSDFAAPFAFREWDPKRKMLVPITDDAKIHEIGRLISPITHVSATAAPSLIIHGDADTLVPIQQAQIFVEKMKTAGVPVELVTKPGAGHGWAEMNKDIPRLADWFDRYLRSEGKGAGAKP